MPLRRRRAEARGEPVDHGLEDIGLAGAGVDPHPPFLDLSDNQVDPIPRDAEARIEIGQIEAPVTLRDDSLAVPTNISGNGKIDHADILVHYRFSEVFGSTGLFAGPGYYRQRLNGQEESNYGLCAGVNGSFPMNRRYALVLEATYHWINFHDRARYLTATGGVKISF